MHDEHCAAHFDVCAGLSISGDFASSENAAQFGELLDEGITNNVLPLSEFMKEGC